MQEANRLNEMNVSTMFLVFTIMDALTKKGVISTDEMRDAIATNLARSAQGPATLKFALEGALQFLDTPDAFLPDWWIQKGEDWPTPPQ